MRWEKAKTSMKYYKYEETLLLYLHYKTKFSYRL